MVYYYEDYKGNELKVKYKLSCGMIECTLYRTINIVGLIFHRKVHISLYDDSMEVLSGWDDVDYRHFTLTSIEFYNTKLKLKRKNKEQVMALKHENRRQSSV